MKHAVIDDVHIIGNFAACYGADGEAPEGTPAGAPMSLELLAKIRAEVDAVVAKLGDLSHGGRFTISQPSVPGLDGDPEIPLLICTPAGAPVSRPAR